MLENQFLCEKPFTINAAEAKQMKAAADANGVALMEAMWARFLPHMHRVREILASGVLGDIWAVEADHGQRLSDYATHVTGNLPLVVARSLILVSIQSHLLIWF
jgi:predicted dehydrogenase